MTRTRKYHLRCFRVRWTKKKLYEAAKKCRAHYPFAIIQTLLHPLTHNLGNISLFGNPPSAGLYELPILFDVQYSLF
jgi:hypothetical protein